MKHTLKFILTVLILTKAFKMFAQQDQMYITYPFMPLNINPAYAGSHEVISASGVFRKRPLVSSAFGVASTSQEYFNFDMPISQDRMAIGFQAYNAEQVLGNGSSGIFGNLGLYGDFAYRFSLPNDGKLAFGVQLGVTQVPVFFTTSGGTGGGGNTAFNATYGAGIYYNNDNAYFGASMLNINASDNYNRPIYISGGYVLTIDDDFKIKTGAVLRKQSSNGSGRTVIDLNATGWINDKFGIGVWYLNTGSDVSNQSILGSFQVQLKKFQFGYSYDFSGSGNVNSLSNEGFHQIMLKYEIDPGNGKSSVFRYF